ncbi:hypothetical protein SLS54_006508 [Diplodia seriata]
MPSNISDAATLIAALKAVDAGNTAAMPTWQKLQLTRSDYAQASHWLSANAPPATSTRTPRRYATTPSAMRLHTFHYPALLALASPANTRPPATSIARNAPALTLTLRFPPPLHAAVLARLKNAVSTRIAALRAKGAPFAAVANQILALDHFPLGTAPVGGTTYLDACWRLQGDGEIAVAVVVVGGGEEVEGVVEDVLVRGDRRVRTLVTVMVGETVEVVRWGLGGDGGGERDGAVDGKGILSRAGLYREVVRGELVLPMQLFRGKVRSPLGQWSFDPVWQQELVIPVVEVVQPFKEVEEREVHVVNVDDEWDMADPDTGHDWVSVENVGEGCISTSDLVGDIFSAPQI